MNVGDYVRTDTGIIQKIDKIYEQNETDDTHIQLNRAGTGKSVFVLDNGKELSYSKGEVIKSSPNIIDLIEVGDYVNGEKVCYLKGQIDEKEVAHEEDVLYTEYYDEYGEWYGYAEDEIETIVTKEQFESMEYKVGE